ncbi:MAG: acyl-CoA reductase [Bacteroidota bacterium]|mgnify:CR=1 FL=1|nr:acyl-CoA reductase [Bacteroidota bacterium]
MQLQQRINAFFKIGNFINEHYESSANKEEENLHLGLSELVKASFLYNGWFIEQFTNNAIQNTGKMLAKEEVEKLSSSFPADNRNPKTVAVICAGNIPMVCFHDVLCVLLSGNTVLIKMSSDDNVLLPFFLKLLVHYEPGFDERIRLADGKLTDFDAIIATGSNNSADQFGYYFAKYPHIIRRNRSSLAVITGKETREELEALGKDIFYYFGLGCRNVSKLLVPKDYKFDALFECVFSYGYVLDNKKYANNYEYNRTIYLMGNEKFLDNNFLMIKSDSQIHAPISVVYYESYESESDVNQYLLNNAKEIQCVVGSNYIPFGNSQSPVITDFADGVNTAEFLVNL